MVVTLRTQGLELTETERLYLQATIRLQLDHFDAVQTVVINLSHLSILLPTYDTELKMIVHLRRGGFFVLNDVDDDLLTLIDRAAARANAQVALSLRRDLMGEGLEEAIYLVQR